MRPAVGAARRRPAPIPAVGQGGEMLPLLKRHEIQTLRRAGHSLRDTARLAEVSLNTVQRVMRETPVVEVDEAKARADRRIGRPSKASPFRAFVAEVLASEPDLMSLEILRRARLKGYAGGKSALYELVAELRPRPRRPVVRFEGLAGEFSQHDFGEVDVRFVDGTRRRVRFFASRLKYSRFVQVTLVPDQTVETLCRALVDHLEAFGGVPLLAIFDRPKTVVLSWRDDGQVTEWNPTFAAVAMDLSLGVELCWPYRPNEKGSVESLVRWVKGSFFKQRRFLDEEDLRAQLAQWLVEVNTKVPSRATGVIPEVRLAEERGRLRPLKVAPQDLALRVPVQVGPTAYVVHDTHHYSMHPDAIGLPGTLFLYRDRVRIVAGRFGAWHQRLFERGAKSTLADHRASHVAAVSGKRAKRYLKRQQILEACPEALDYLTELIHRRSGAWTRDVDEIHALLARVGPEVLRDAIVRAHEAGTFGAEYVAHHIREPLLPLGSSSTAELTR